MQKQPQLFEPIAWTPTISKPQRYCANSLPNAAMSRPRAALTPCVLCSARSARQASPVHRNRTKFATRSRVFSRKFARFRIHDSKIFGAKCITDSAQSFCDVMIVAQPTQRTPAEFCVRGTQNLHQICNTSPRFLAKLCSISNVLIAKCQCQVQR